MVEALTPVEVQDWQDELPNDADIVSCRQELRRTQSNPAPGGVEVCGTPYTVDTGTGVGEVVQDCVYEIYDELCTYTELQWRDFDLITLTGDDFDRQTAESKPDAGPAVWGIAQRRTKFIFGQTAVPTPTAPTI